MFQYEKLNIQVIALEEVDVITTSNTLTNGNKDENVLPFFKEENVF